MKKKFPKKTQKARLDINAYALEFSSQRSLDENCSVCKSKLKYEYFTIPNDEVGVLTHARMKENRMCSKKCINYVTHNLNIKEKHGMSRETYNNSVSD